jgi:hypothetical protein
MDKSLSTPETSLAKVRRLDSTLLASEGFSSQLAASSSLGQFAFSRANIDESISS